MKKSAIVLVGLLGLTATACGDDGGSSTAFADQLSDTCQTLDTALGKLDQPTDLKGMRSFATDASDLYDTAVSALKKLTPTGDAKDAFEELRDNMASQLDLLDDVARSAKDDDQDGVDAAIAKFQALVDDNAGLARDAGARRCAIDSPLAMAGPTDSTTDVTTDVTTDDTTGVTTTTSTKATLPPVTASTTKPSTTESSTAVGSGEKIFEDLPSQLGVSTAGYTFTAVEQQYIDNFLKFLTRTKAMDGATGHYGAVEIAKDGQPFGRVFAFVADPALPAGSIRELVEDLASGQPVTDTAVNKIDGLHFTSTDAYEFFVAGDETNGMFMFVTRDEESMDAAVTAFFESIQG